jgi:ureidoacrylate peracid hydrolase
MNGDTAPSDLRHPNGLFDSVVAKVLARRGRLHAFEALDLRRTAFVVIDMNTGSVAQDATCHTMVPRINVIANALREAGGCVAWVLSKFAATPNTTTMYGKDAARFAIETSGDKSSIWPALSVGGDDLHAIKHGHSAFFPGKCNLHEHLQSRDIATLFIGGTVTNVCVDSSARDAVELGYRVTLVSDACAGHSHGLHEATLNTFYRCFGDVRPTTEIIDLIAEGQARP